ncbi:hypothetical protein EH31_11910 [Erythrobacter longus]|uniref:HTH lacI-type domain-containing protein n=2 Tax=Erythrobacter longus TaxID=1044 RepID=A0A074M570_ERYLO|nr:hypothetical protein EH31_11910 [Erythrobacter longus]
MTVSRVINQESGVRTDTREKVLEAVETLNYRPNKSARTLARGADAHIGLIYANPSDSYLGRFLHGALEAAQRTDSHLIVETCDNKSTASYVASAMRLVRANVAGVLLPPPISGSDAVLSIFEESGTPVATVSRFSQDPNALDISIDDKGAAAQMTRHLIDLGHRRIGFIRGPADQASSKLREDGFRGEMQNAALDIPPDYIVDGQFTYRSGVSAAEQLIDLEVPPTAIFASNDDMAAAAIGVAHRRGLVVPGDLSVVGFDNSASALSVWPELTTVDQPVSAMASAAFELVREAVSTEPQNTDTPRAGPAIECGLIIRGSSGAATQTT